jgi:tRNA/rRNA methyltransferase
MSQPAIILVKPQLGENIGMVARAMLNCGLTDLRVVSPRDGWPSETAQRASSGALAKGVEVTIYDTTQEAVSDLHFILATTARPREMIKDVYTPEKAIESIHSRISKKNNKCAILFGGERAGLHNDDIALSHGIITVPLNPEFTSLNLAQAVLLLSYEWIKKMDTTQDIQFHTGDTEIAPRSEVDGLVGRLEKELDTHHFFRSEGLRPTVLRNITNLFSRMSITSQEVKTFHGIISALIGQKTPTDKN